MKSNLPDEGHDLSPDEKREIDSDIMHDAVMTAIPRRFKDRRDRAGLPIHVHVDPDECSVVLKKSRRARRSFRVVVDRAGSPGDCGDGECLGCRTRVLAHVVARVLGEGS